MNEMDEILKLFLAESHENLDRVDRELIVLEECPDSKEMIASIFRAMHTIKGSCGFFDFLKLQKITHVGENLLSRVRDGKLPLTTEIISALLALTDAIRHMFSNVERNGNEGEEDYSELVARLNWLQVVNEVAAGSMESGVVPEPVAGNARADVAFRAEPSSPTPTLSPAVSTSVVPASSVGAAGHALSESPGCEKPSGSSISANSPAKEGHEARAGVSDNNIRVDVLLLDRLMNLVGELVLARNQILQFTQLQEDVSLLATSQRLNQIVTELQEGVMKARMQQIGTIWNKFPRVIRDLSVSCGKQVRLAMEGRETELDKTIIEAIKDPLTHLIRNSVDHGIEIPDQRCSRGKPAEGLLTLRAFHEGGQVNIEISDDGAGIDPERLKNKAVNNRLISQEQAARMSEREAIHLIFAPGFSTAEKVTAISGRGVGMDVVKTNIEKIGGTIDIQSQLLRGTTMRIKIPLTLAIIPALIVASGGDRFAIPQASLLELIHLEGHRARQGIECMLGTFVYRLRGQLLPLTFLNAEFGLCPLPASGLHIGEDGINIVVLQADNRHFGLVVDDIHNTEEIVVKPLGQQLKCVKTFAGATIMGDGHVALILDVVGIAQQSRVITEGRKVAHANNALSGHVSDDGKQAMLLFEAGDHGRMVVPLGKVSRLEEFTVASIEFAGDQEVVQYRDSILPLLRLTEVFPERRSVSRHGGSSHTNRNVDTIQVLVYSEADFSAGIVVGSILDVVEASLENMHPASRAGILGTIIIHNRVTQVLDIEGIIGSSHLGNSLRPRLSLDDDASAMF